MTTASPTHAPAPTRPAREPIRDWYQATLALLLLALVGVSLVFTARQATLTFDRLTTFLERNQLGTPDRTALILAVLAGGALPVLIGAVSLWRWRQGAAVALWRAAWLCSPLLLAWALPSLLSYRTWYDNPTPYLIFIAVFVLLAEQVFRQFWLHFPESLALRLAALAARFPRVRRALPFTIALMAGAWYAIFTGYYSLQQHARGATSGYDLGIYDNLIFSNLHGRFFHCPILRPGLSYLSNHAEFGTILIAPIYALHPGPEILLVLQALAIGSATIPLYLFASTQISRGGAALIAVAYVLFAPMHGASFYDFHWVPMALPLWFWLFFVIARRKRWAVALLTVLLLPIREEVGVMLAVLGAFLLVTGYWRKLGLVFMVVGPLWFGAMRFVVMPLAGSWWFDNMYQDLIPPGEQGFGGVVRTLLTNPNYLWKTLATEQKLTLALHLFAPVAFLPLRRPALALLAIPGFFFTLLTTNYPHTLSIHFQYSSHWVPWLFASSVLALKVFRDGELSIPRYRAGLSALAFGVFCHSYVFGALLQQNVFIGGFGRVPFRITAEEQKRAQTARRLVAQIPRTASAAATEHYAAHSATRIDAYTLLVAHGEADYLLLYQPELGGDQRSNAQKAMSLHPYGLVDSGDGLFLFKKGFESPGTSAALHALGLHTRGVP